MASNKKKATMEQVICLYLYSFSDAELFYLRAILEDKAS